MLFKKVTITNTFLEDEIAYMQLFKTKQWSEILKIIVFREVDINS